MDTKHQPLLSHREKNHFMLTIVSLLRQLNQSKMSLNDRTVSILVLGWGQVDWLLMGKNIFSRKDHATLLNGYLKDMFGEEVCGR